MYEMRSDEVYEMRVVVAAVVSNVVKYQPRRKRASMDSGIKKTFNVLPTSHRRLDSVVLLSIEPPTEPGK